jgi:hypothetical protein
MKLKQRILRLVIIAGLVASVACKPTTPEDSSLQSEGTTARPQWIKAPQIIVRTIRTSWGLEMSETDEASYVGSVYGLLGGTSVATMTSPLSKPNILFVLATERLSGWIAERLVSKQIADQEANRRSVFEGLETTSMPDRDSCFADDSKLWCDVDDGIAVGSLAKAGVDPGSLGKSWRKKLMHNIQDLGDYLGLEVDNLLLVDGAPEGHAAAYLLDQVFLKALAGEATAAREQRAWEGVLVALLMSGGFFFAAPLIDQGA